MKGLKGFQKGESWNRGIHTGIKPKNAFKKGHAGYWSGKSPSREVRDKISKSMEGTGQGSKNTLWKGGITPINLAVRMSAKYKRWRTAIYERDSYTCRECKQIGGKLNADHIKPFSLYPEFRFELSNGRTLCVSCHKKTSTYGGKVLKKQAMEILK